jgi:hypothetical protein
VVDIERRIMAVGGELHSDEEAALLDDGSLQSDLWGINLYTSHSSDDWIEFDSMNNLRPAQRNRSRGVDDPSLRDRIRRVVYGVDVELSLPGMVRAIARRNGESTRVDWAHDSAWRFMPPVRDALGRLLAASCGSRDQQGARAGGPGRGARFRRHPVRARASVATRGPLLGGLERRSDASQRVTH